MELLGKVPDFGTRKIPINMSLLPSGNYLLKIRKEFIY